MVSCPKRPSLNLPPTAPQVFGPVLAVSLVFHGALLLLPLPRSSQPPTAAPESSQSVETVDLSDLLAPNPAVPPVPPAAQPPPAESPPTAQTPYPPLPAIAAPAPVPSSPATIVDPSEAPEFTPLAATDPEATNSPTPEPSPQLDGVQTFFDQLAATTGVSVSAPTPDLFAEPDRYFAAIAPDFSLRPEVLRAVWMAGKTPDQVYISVLSSQLQTENFQSVQRNDFGGGLVYEVTHGSDTWYLNLVPTLDGDGTVIVVWQQDPSRLDAT